MINTLTLKFVETAPCRSLRRSRRQRPAIAGAEDEGEDLEPVHGDAHHLGGERILPQRAPRAPGARLVGEVERHREEYVYKDDQEEEVQLLRRVEAELEEGDRIELREPIGAAGEAFSRRSWGWPRR